MFITAGEAVMGFLLSGRQSRPAPSESVVLVVRQLLSSCNIDFEMFFEQY